MKPDLVISNPCYSILIIVPLDMNTVTIRVIRSEEVKQGLEHDT